MENLKKINIYAHDKKTIYAVAVNGENERMIIDNYLDFQNSIFAMYKDINGKSTTDLNDAINELSTSGNLIKNIKNVIVEITVMPDGGYEIKRADGKVENLSFTEDDFAEKWNTIYGEIDTIYGGMDTLKKLGILKTKYFDEIKKTDEDDEYDNEDTYEEDDEYDDEDEYEEDDEYRKNLANRIKEKVKGVKNLKIFKKGIIKKGLAFATAVAVGFGAGHIMKKNNETYVNDDSITTTNPVENPDNYLTAVPSTTTSAPVYVESEETYIPEFPVDELATPTANIDFNEYTPITEKNRFLVMVIYDDGTTCTSYMDASYNDIVYHAETSANEIMDYIAHPEYNSKPTVGFCVAYSDSIENPAEKAYVSYFENIRNSLVYSYFKGEMDDYDKYSKKGCIGIISYLERDKALEEDGYTLCYSDLSSETKDVVTKIFKDILDMSQNTIFEYNGQTYGFDDVQDIVYSKIDALDETMTK